MHTIICPAMTKSLCNKSVNEEDVPLLAELIPVTTLTLSFATQSETGEMLTMTHTIRGEDAEFLPVIVRNIGEFLQKVGFQANLEVVEDQSNRMGAALQALIGQDNGHC